MEIAYFDEQGEKWVFQARSLQTKVHCKECSVPTYNVLCNCRSGDIACLEHFEFLGYGLGNPTQYNIRRKF